MTRNPSRPGPLDIKPPFDYIFKHLESVREEFSRRAHIGVPTRRTIDKECRQCYFGHVFRYTYDKQRVIPCTKGNPRYCKHGAWTEERLIDYTIERYTAALKKHSQLSVQDAWVVARLAGFPFKIRSEQTNCKQGWQICRINTQGRTGNTAARILISRTARDARDMTLDFITFAALQNFLPDSMQKYVEQAKEKPLDREAFALWAHASTLTNGKSYSCYIGEGGFIQHQPPVGAVFCTANGSVRVELCYSRKEEYVTFYNFQKLYAYTNGLMLFNINHVEDEDFIPTLLGSNRP